MQHDSKTNFLPGIQSGLIAMSFLLLNNNLVAIEQKKPNLLFIMTEQQRFDALSLAGNEVLKTPNLDRLAKQGAWFKPPEHNENRLTVYPNPSHGQYNLILNPSRQYQMIVYDSFGKLLLNRKSDNTLETINLTGYSAGVYILSILADKNNYVQKLIKL